MAVPRTVVDPRRVKVARLLVVGALAVLAAFAGGVATAGGPPSCGSGSHGSSGYAYAGHQSQIKGHGVRARVSLLIRPEVESGHAAAWIGVGGPDSGPNGEDEWIQVGIAALPNLEPMLYAEIARPGAGPEFVPLQDTVPVGATRSLAVLEMNKRPGYWRVWVDGEPVTAPIRLPGSSGRWEPIATAESWNGGQPICNRFAFRFERVGVAGWRGGSWHQFHPGYRFLDQGYSLRQLRPSPGGARTLAADSIRPFAFEAVSS
jgi:hypothetical protein